MIIVDTSVWIDFFNGRVSRQTDALEAVLGVEPVGIGDVILLEILQGFRSETDARRARAALQAVPIVHMLGTFRAVRCAERYRTLRRLGVTVRKSADLIIASCCIDEGLPLLHADRDFDPFVEHLGLLTYP